MMLKDEKGDIFISCSQKKLINLSIIVRNVQFIRYKYEFFLIAILGKPSFFLYQLTLCIVKGENSWNVSILLMHEKIWCSDKIMSSHNQNQSQNALWLLADVLCSLRIVFSQSQSTISSTVLSSTFLPFTRRYFRKYLSARLWRFGQMPKEKVKSFVSKEQGQRREREKTETVPQAS